MISDYKLLFSSSPSELETMVLNYLRNGWTVLNGPLISHSGYIYQAMVYEK